MQYDFSHSSVSTLFYPFENDLAAPLFGKILFLNAAPYVGLNGLDVTMQHVFKPYADLMESQGYRVVQDVPEDQGAYDYVLILLPKNKLEAVYLIARGLKAIKPEGKIFCAAGNKEGGKNLQKMLHKFGLSTIQYISKNKARAAWGSVNKIDEKSLSQALSAGSVQKILDGEYQSQPGVFGWDKVDKGSEILLQHMPKNLSGDIADFGCGYGYLSRAIAQQNPAIDSFTCIDADARAVKLCQENLIAFERCHFLWSDLTQPLNAGRYFDVIIMNPPFHDGKQTETALGKAFIDTAHKALKAGGALYMVANVHLPYEDKLQALFSESKKLYEGQGFKIFKAVK